MKAIKPITVSESKLTSSTIPEPDINAGEVEYTTLSGKHIHSAAQAPFRSCKYKDNTFIANGYSNNYVISVHDNRMNHVSDLFDCSSELTTSYPLGIAFANNEIYILQNGIYDVFVYDHLGNYTGRSFSISSKTVGANCMAWDGAFLYALDSTTVPTEVTVYIYSTAGVFQNKYTLSDLNGNKSISDADFYNGDLYFNNRLGATLIRVSSEHNIVSEVSLLNGAGIGALPLGLSISNEGVVFSSITALTDYYTDELSIYGEFGYFALPGEQCVLTSEHKKYQATAVTLDDPLSGTLLTPPTWVEVGATNRYAAFDHVVSSASVGQSPMVVELTPGELFDSISCLNVGGASDINIVVTDPVAGEVYNESIEMTDNTEISDWYQYLWAGFELSTSFVKLDLPPYANATVKITLTGADEIYIGVLVVGKSVTLGEANYGSSIQQLNFSRVEEDEFGSINVVKRPGAKLVNYDVSVMKTRLNYTYNQLEELRDIPTVWVGTGSVQDETLVYGYHVDNKLNIDSPTICSVDLTIRGLI